MLERLQEFAVSMSSISQIYFHILNTERRRVKLLPKWKQLLLLRSKSKSTMFMEALAKMSDLDIAKITEEALGCCLPQFEQSSEEPKKQFPATECLDEFAALSEIPQLHAASGAFVSSSHAAVKEEPPLPHPSTKVQTAQSRKFHQKASGNWAALRDAVSSRSSAGDQYSHRLPTVKQPQATTGGSLVELQEVVIAGADTGTGTQSSKVHQRRSIVQRGSSDVAAALKTTSSGSSAVMAVKTIGALAPEHRGKGGAMALMAAIRRPVEAVGSSFQMKDPTYNVEQQPSRIPTATVGAAGTVAPANIPQPPPRSRSHSRISGSDASGATRVDALNLQPSASACDDPMHQASTAYAPALQRNSAIPRNTSRHSPATSTSVLAATEPCGIGIAQPPPPPRSRSQSRIRAAAAASVDVLRAGHALPQGAAQDATQKVAQSAHDDGTARRFGSPTTAQAPAGAAARSSRPSKKHVSKPDGAQPPPISVVQRLRIMGAEYEEC
jgi:hypothetical protein